MTCIFIKRTCMSIFSKIESVNQSKPCTQIYLQQDAREAMRVVFSVLTKRICMHKTKFLMNIFKYCFKNYIKLHEFANCNSANYDV